MKIDFNANKIKNNIIIYIKLPNQKNIFSMSDKFQ